MQMDTICSNAQYAEGILFNIECAFIKLGNTYIRVIPLIKNTQYDGNTYEYKINSQIIKSISRTDFQLIYKEFYYRDFKRIQQYILDPYFPLLIFPGITCDQQNWIDQTKQYCAFHSVLHIFLRSDMCSAHISRHMSYENEYISLLNKLKNDSIQTNSDDIISLLKILQDAHFFVCKTPYPDNFAMNPIIFTMIFLNTLGVLWYSDITPQYYEQYYERYSKIFPTLPDKLPPDKTLDNSNIAIIKVLKMSENDEDDHKVWGINPKIKEKLNNNFVLDGAFLSNKKHSIAGITCLKTKYIINNGISVDHDWTTTYIQQFQPVFFVYVRIEKGGCFDLKQKRRILIKHKSDNQS